LRCSVGVVAFFVLCIRDMLRSFDNAGTDMGERRVCAWFVAREMRKVLDGDGDGGMFEQGKQKTGTRYVYKNSIMIILAHIESSS
jgi:hypothetical protein